MAVTILVCIAVYVLVGLAFGAYDLLTSGHKPTAGELALSLVLNALLGAPVLCVVCVQYGFYGAGYAAGYVVAEVRRGYADGGKQ
jgi:hypothetical protein